jgi:hypothetical protein
LETDVGLKWTVWTVLTPIFEEQMAVFRCRLPKTHVLNKNSCFLGGRLTIELWSAICSEILFMVFFSGGKRTLHKVSPVDFDELGWS